MRRLFAYITLAITMLVAILIAVPGIKDTTNPGTEFGEGYTVLYHVTDSETNEFIGTELKTKVNAAVKNINSRLKTMNISNPEVDVENSSYIRVTLPDMPVAELNNIKNVLANNGEITVRDTEDNLLVAGKDVFSKMFISVQNGTPVLSVKLKDAALWGSVTEEAASTYAGSSEDPVPNVIIWTGYQTEYTEKLADRLGYSGDKFAEVEANPFARSKVLATLAVDSRVEEDFGIATLVSNSDVTIYNNILSKEGNTYNLNEEYSAKAGSYLSTKAPLRAVVAGLIGLAATIVLLIVAYSVAGIASSLSIVAVAVLVCLTYNLFGGLFGAETIIALIVGIGLAVDANIVILERIKDEIRKGKSIARSFEEGSKKSVSTILDSNVLVILAALALYLFGNQVVKSFSAVLILSQVAIILVVILLTRFMLSLICNSRLVDGKPGLFGVKKSEIVDIHAEDFVSVPNKFEKVKFVKNGKVRGIISGAITVAGVVVALILGLINNSSFNFSSNLSNGTRVYYRTVDPTMSEVVNVSEFFADSSMIGKKPAKITIADDSITVSNENLQEYKELFAEYHLDVDEVSRNKVKVYCVTVYYNGKLSDSQIDTISDYFKVEESKFYDADEEIEILETNFSVGEFNPTSGVSAMLNMLYAVGMLVVFVFVYLSIRFKLSYSISAILTLLHNELIFFAILAITRLPIGSWFIGAALAVAVFTLGNTSITFDKLRENVTEAKNVIWTIDTRKEYINKSLQQTMYGHLFTNIATLVVGLLVLAAGGLSIASVGAVCIIAVVVASYGSYLIMPFIWAKLDTVFANIRAKGKEKRALRAQKNNPDLNQPEEYTFFGIND